MDPVPFEPPRLPPAASAGYEDLGPVDVGPDAAADDVAADAGAVHADAVQSPDPAPRWWDANADDYLSEHGSALGQVDFVWGPEGLREEDAHLLGSPGLLAGARVLEIGAGAAQCSRWLRSRGVDVVASDVSAGMLSAAARLNAVTGVDVPLALADARHLPFEDGSFDVVFTSYGVLPFVSDADAVHREVARVLRPGGRWVFSTTHPIRWAFPDDPGPGGLTASSPYADTRAYVERAQDGEIVYAEYHRTLAQHVGEVVAAGFVVVGLAEPAWQPGRETWGGWSELRAVHLPGTLILSCRRE